MREKYAYFLEGTRTNPAAEEGTGLDEDALSEPRQCALGSRPARHQVEGVPQQLDPADCGTGETSPRPQPTRAAPREVKVVPVGRRVQAAGTPDPIAAAVAGAGCPVPVTGPWSRAP
ncbi:hypothetical protein [Streptomyces sp. NPDC093990]|uniref:hypothetical protein n=1 Tax=Streptomyces sp. NPDC093990 TaxID=3155306 RepID=UPI00341E841B